MGAWLRFEKKAWGVHKSLQLHLLDQEHHGLWLGSKDIKVDYLMCVCVFSVVSTDLLSERQQVTTNKTCCAGRSTPVFLLMSSHIHIVMTATALITDRQVFCSAGI